VADQDPPIPDAWLAALAASLEVFARLVEDPQVSHTWSTASNLDGYTAGGIAGHVLSLIEGLQGRLEAGAVEVRPISQADWYRSALAGGARHDALIAVGEALAEDGPAALAARLRSAADALVHALRHAPRDQLVPLASIPGAGVRLDEFVMTRFVEITVHADDIATVVGLPSPTFRALAWELGAQVMADVSGTAGEVAQRVGARSAADTVRAASRPAGQRG
jgi:hypothetical protein